MPVLPCPLGADCTKGENDTTWKTVDIAFDQAQALVADHIKYAHQAAAAGAAPAQLKAEKLVRPSLKVKDSLIDEEAYEFFLHQWSTYKTQANLTHSAKQHLESCLGYDITHILFSRLGQAGWDLLTEQTLLDTVKEVFVKRRNRMINRLKLRNLKQGPEQPVQQYVASLKQISRTCKFSIECSADHCNQKNDFSEEMVLDQLVQGLNDDEIQKKVLSIQEENFNLDHVEKLIMNEECGKATQKDSKVNDSTAAGLSTFKRNKRDQFKNVAKKPNDENKKQSCYSCGSDSHKYGDLKDKSECPAHNKFCSGCGKRGHLESVCRSKGRDNKTKEADHDFMSLLALITSANICSISSPRPRQNRQYMGHMRFDKHRGEFVPVAVKKNNIMTVNIELDGHNFYQLGGKGELPGNKLTGRDAVGDTGASICCTATADIAKLGLSEDRIFQSDLKLFAADKRRLPIRGYIPVNISIKAKNGSVVTTTELLYFVDGLKGTFLSKDALSQLRIIPKNFPEAQVETVFANDESKDDDNKKETVLEKCDKPDSIAPCGCLLRTKTPDPPRLDKDIETYSVDELKQILIDHYRSSTFNTCPHQPLPLMHGPPLEFHVDPEAKPFVCHTPASVPAHWEKKVKEDLERDVAMGVLEKVEPNTPVTWCHRMVLQRKHNGDPRRTVDLQPLNEACKRQTHHTAPPLQQALTVPHGTLKSTNDAWNGFHSLELREEDKHFTTFITPFGRYRYKRGPQGWLSTGDGYTQRFDKITENVKQKRQVIDDSLLYSFSVKEAFSENASYLTLVGKNGIILNPEKFQFAQETVNWAGVKITKNSVEPLNDHVESIRSYPTPLNLTDMRSFFALVEQISPYVMVKPHLGPFRELLKKDRKFYWDEHLQKLFEEVKLDLVEKITEGLTRFETDRHTALMTDYSKTGIGFILSQKYCKCETISPVCCKGGWKVCLVGSRFTNQAESNYAPIEGELLAVTYGLKKTKYYTLGSEKLIIGVDHKPLLGILNDCPLEKIDNRRLSNLKEKTLGWRYKIIHISGSKLTGADALSRIPIDDKADLRLIEANTKMSELFEDIDSGSDSEDSLSHIFAALRVGSEINADDLLDMDNDADILLGNIGHSANVVTWEIVKKSVKDDATSQLLSNWIMEGCQGSLTDLPDTLRPYWRIRDQLRIHDDVPMVTDRVVIPESLRPRVLETLHSAHQGTFSMMLRAQDTIYWPGFSTDIENVRLRCQTCQRIAPSQPNLPPIDPIIPEYPFQHICMDHFILNNHSYGVFVDRFTNWPGVYIGDSSKDVCNVLARISEDYGIPETVSTDGGRNYTSEKVKTFMKQFGIKHRVSSVANAHSNCRAELGVKSMKRLIRENVTLSGELETAKFSRAILQYRNTKDRDTGKSPAEFLMGRQLRDFLPRPKDQLVGKTWSLLASQREAALALRGAKLKERLSERTKELKELNEGDQVIIQNQTGNYPLRWDKTGTVIKIKGYDQYQVMTHGSRRLTLRNRKFLRKIEHPNQRFLPFSNDIDSSPPTSKIQPPTSTPQLPPLIYQEPHKAQRSPAEDESFFTPKQSPQAVRDNQNRFNDMMNEAQPTPVSTPTSSSPPVDTEASSPSPASSSPSLLPPPPPALASPKIRKSSRVNKGMTTKYDDYVRSVEATATRSPEADKSFQSSQDLEGEDITDIIPDTDDGKVDACAEGAQA